MGVVERFEGEFFRLCKQRALHVLPIFTEAGLALGATLLAPMRRNAAGVETLDFSGEDRILAALTAAFLAPVDGALLGKLRRACDLWASGEKGLAQIYLAGLRLPRIDAEQALRLHLADRLMASGFSPRGLCKQLGFALPPGLGKYSLDQPRDSDGRWSSGAGGGGSYLSYAEPNSARQPKPPAPSAAAAAGAAADAAAEGAILGPLDAEALAGLASIAASFAGATAAFGLLFIPSPNPGMTSQGAVPGEPGLDYSVDHDEGLLRITRGADETVLAAHLGPDGLYRDETGAPIARATGGGIVVDPDAVRAATKAKEGGAEGINAGADAATESQREEPKLCPDPGPDRAGGRKAFDIQYEQYVRSVVNPQRQPPLPAGLAFSLTNPVTGDPVLFDDCRESDGTMIEAKGHYEELMRSVWGRDETREDFKKQATRQVEASGGREIEWYFHEQAAADLARRLFDDNADLSRIKTNFLPDPAGIPKPNLRIK